MPRDITARKRFILGTLVVLGAADLALTAYSWQLASAPQTSEREFARQERELKKIHAEIERAQKIRQEMPATQKDCEKFEKSLLPASSGYSSVSSELGEIAKSSGVRLQGLAFKPTAIAKRGMTELALESSIEGNYKSVILFLSGLQRSHDNYVVESLTLSPSNTGPGQTQAPSDVIKVSLHMKTYLRTAA